MGDKEANNSQVFRVGLVPIVIVTLFAVLLAALGALVGVKNGEWTLFAIVIGAFGIVFLLLQVLRLEIGSDHFKYRNLSGSRSVAFADINRAYFQVLRRSSSPQGVAVFWVERRDGRRLKINLRTFPIEGAAALFTALESHGVSIDVPDLWAARRIADQVRAGQTKM